MSLDSSPRSATPPRVSWLDRLGIAVSAFCLLQCLALPLALVFSPLAGYALFDHELFHRILLLLILPVSILAFTLGFWRHRNLRMLVPAGIGLGLLLLAGWLEHGHRLAPGWIALVTSAGGIGLIVGHLINMRQRGVG
ncbi:MAG: MerC domain-containing protein [Wenzhouxiangellaceae bacterium]|nr:MerC domain-containing protein [Wenzhouxiangellaceae bacterium]